MDQDVSRDVDVAMEVFNCLTPEHQERVRVLFRRLLDGVPYMMMHATVLLRERQRWNRKRRRR